MKLTLRERGMLHDLIPSEGHYADIVEVRKIRELLSYTPEEMTEFNIHFTPDGQIRWKPDEKSITYLSNIPFTEWITVKIQTKLRELEANGKLTEALITLYEKFITQYEFEE